MKEKSVSKKLLSLFLAVIMLLGTVPLNELAEFEFLNFGSIRASAKENESGERFAFPSQVSVDFSPEAIISKTKKNISETISELLTSKAAAKNKSAALKSAPKKAHSKISWSYDKESATLTVTGSGEISGYDIAEDNINTAPWGEKLKTAKKIVIGEGITGIGACSFAFALEAETIVFPSTLETISEGAFMYALSLKELILPEGLQYVDDDAFVALLSLEKLIIPATLDSFPKGFCSDNASLSLTTVINNSKTACVELLDRNVFIADKKAADFYVYCSKRSYALGLSERFADEEALVKDISKYIEDNFNVYIDFINNRTDALEAWMEFKVGTSIASCPPQWLSIECDAASSQHNYCKSNVIMHKTHGNDEDCLCFDMSGTFGDNITWKVDRGAKTLVFDGRGDFPTKSDGKNKYVNYGKYIEHINFAEGSSITSFPMYVASGLEIVDITLPSSMKYSDDVGTFCIESQSLSDVYVQDGNSELFSNGGILFAKIENETFLVCYPKSRIDEEYTVPDNVTAIASLCFFDSKAKTIKLKENVNYLAGMGIFALSKADIWVLNPDCKTDEEGSAFSAFNGVLHSYPETEVCRAAQNARIKCSVIESKEIVSVEVETLPTKTEYVQLDEFISDGLTVKVNYSDGTSAIRTTGYSVTGFNSKKAGICTLSVNYNGFITMFDVTVKSMPGTPISLNETVEINLDNNYSTYYKFKPSFSGNHLLKFKNVSGTYCHYEVYDNAFNMINSYSASSDASLTCKLEVGASYYIKIENASSDILTAKLTVECGHDGEWTVVTPKTCTSDGEESRKCTNCGETETRVIPASHNFGEWIIKEATCTVDGEKKRTCIDCGETEIEVIDADHDWKIKCIKQPTCTEPGLYRGTCSVCGESFDDTGSALGHEYVDGVCIRCGYSLSDSESILINETKTVFVVEGGSAVLGFIPKNSGKYTVTAEDNKGGYCKELTLRDADYNYIKATYQHEICEITYDFIGGSKYFIEVEFGDSLASGDINISLKCNHTGKWRQTVTPTCLTDGEEACTCTQCGQQVTRTVKGEHDYQLTERKNSTCTENGYEKYACSVCGIEKTVTLFAGHVYREPTEVVEATCISNGHKTYTCENCGHSYDQKIYSTGHSFDNGICVNCEKSKSEYKSQFKIALSETKTIEMAGNNYEYIEFKAEKDGVFVFSADSWIYLYDSSYQQIGHGGNREFEAAFEKGKTYYFKVSLEPGERTISLRDFAENSIELGKPITVKKSDGEKWFRFDLPKSGNYEFSVENTGDRGHTYIYKYNIYDVSNYWSRLSIDNNDYDICDFDSEAYYLKINTRADSATVTVRCVLHTDENSDRVCDFCKISYDEVIETGSCGENVIYTLTADGVLKFTGNGEITSYNTVSYGHNNYVKTVVVDEGITAICDSCISYFDCLEKISLPKSLASLGNRNCNYRLPLLKTIEIDKDNANYTIENKALYTKDKKTLLAYPCAAGATEFTVPDGVETIGISAFYGNAQLQSVVLPDTLVKIEEYAFFRNIALKSIVFPESLREIGAYAFYECYGHNGELIIPKSVEKIDSGAFFEIRCTEIIVLNPECALNTDTTYDYYPSLWPVADSDGDGEIDSVGAISGYTGSTAEDYCERLGITFESLDSKYVTDLKMISLPDKTEFSETDDFSADGLKVLVTYNDGSTAEKNYYSCDISGFDRTKYGKSTITATYKGFDVTYDITVTEVEEKTVGVPFKAEENRGWIKFVAKADANYALKCLDENVGSYNNIYADNGTTLMLADGMVAGKTYYAEFNAYVDWTADSLFCIMCKNESSHDYKQSGYVEPTCMATGKIIYKCELCDYVKEDSLEKVDHRYSEEWTVDVEATCTKNGSKSHHCVFGCGAKTDDAEIQATGHSFGEFETYIEPTCTQKGRMVRFCSKCGIREYKDIEAHGHDYSAEWTIDTAATCTVDGSKSHHCSRCSSKSDVTVIKAEGHSFGEFAVSKEPTCTVKGQKVKTCSKCDTKEYEEIGALGHDYSTEWTIDTAATCTVNGSKSHHCSRCSSKSDVTVIKADGHSFGEFAVIKESTCTVKGQKVKTCSKCDTKEYEEIGALGHDYSAEWTIDTAATCTVDGSKSHHCSRCSSKSDVTVIKAEGHSFGEFAVSKEPTCTVKGQKVKTCSKCDTKEYEEIGALGHDYSAVWTIDTAATCTVDGSKSHHCSRCSGKSDVTVIKAEGHSYSSVVTEPTCVTDGYTTHTCSVCGYSYKDSYVKADGHSFGEWTTKKNATCENVGQKTRTCSVCKFIQTDSIPALGHKFGEWEILKEATVVAEGNKERICETCSKKETQNISRIEVDISQTDEYGLAVFTVVNAQTLEPIEGAGIFVSTESDGESTFFTDAEGKVSVILPVGKQTVSAYAQGCLTRNLSISVKTGINEIPKIGLSDRKTYDAELTHERMTKEDIEKAGIDFDDSDNNHMFKYDLNLKFTPEIDWISISAYFDSDGNLKGASSNSRSGSGSGSDDSGSGKPSYTLHYHVEPGGYWHTWCKFDEVKAGTTQSLSYTPWRDNDDYIFDGWYEDSEYTKKISSVRIRSYEETGSYTTTVYGCWIYVGTGKKESKIISGGIYVPEANVTVYPVSEYLYLIIHGEVHWMKEMFDVELLVFNNSNTDTLEDLTANLQLPEGLSLASMVDGEQTLEQFIGTIPEGESRSVHWYVRGDTAGDYSFSANLKGKVMPFEEEIDDLFTVESKLHVWAGNALHLDFSFPKAAYYGENYPVTITLTNVSDITLYNVSSMIAGVEQCHVVHYSDGTVKEEWKNNNISGSKFCSEFNPSDKIVIELNIEILFESELMQYQLNKLCRFIDGAEQLLKAYKAVKSGLDIATALTKSISKASKALDLKDTVLATIDKDKLASAKKLYSSISSLITKYGSSGNKQVDKGAKVLSAGVDEVLDVLSADGVADYLNKKNPEDIVKLADKIDSFAEGFAATDEEVKKFDIWDSIRTMISSVPVVWALKGVTVDDDDPANTTKIPWSYNVTNSGAHYFGVSNVSSYLSNIMKAAMAEYWKDNFSGIIPKLAGIDDPFDYDSIKRDIIAIENEVKQYKAKDTTGTVKFKAYVVKNSASAKLRSIFAAFTADDEFILNCPDNDTAKFENGVLTFTGEGTIEVTPKSLDGGTLYIEADNGAEYEYNISVVEQHECEIGEYTTIISPTSISDGFAVGTCKACGDILDIKPMSADGCKHTFGDWQYTAEVSCTGCNMKTRICTKCAYAKTEIFDAEGHSYASPEYVWDGDACTATRICTVCTEETDGHSESATQAGVYVKDADATCTEPEKGHYEAVFSEERFGSAKTENGSISKGNATGHIGGTAYCKERAICSVCGAAYGELNVENHKNAVKDKAIDATCTSAGLTEGSHCGDCGKVIVAQTATQKLPHCEATDKAVAPTCTKTGLTEGKHCSVCGTVLAAQKEVKSLGHKYAKSVVKANLSADGKIVEKCTVCNAIKSTTAIAKIKSVTLSKSAYTYNGKAQKPVVTVKDSKSKALKNGTDYTVTYKNNTNIGKATVVVTFKGNYSGSKTLNFNILPPQTSKITVKQTASKITASWKKVSGASGYKVELYKGKKLVKTVDTMKLSATFSELSKGTEYKIVVKAYVKIDGKKVVSLVSKTLVTATKTSAPSGVKAKAEKKSAKVSWKKVSGADNYTVYYSTKKNGSYKTMTVAKTSATVKKLTKRKTYYFKVTANKKGTESDCSKTVRVKIK